MAINTAEKRQSALLSEGLVLPDGRISLRDRAVLLDQYAGIAAADFSAFTRTQTRRSVEFVAQREKP